MGDTKVDNRPKEVYRPERPDSKSSSLLMPNYQGKSDFQKILESSDQKGSSPSDSGQPGQPQNTETKEAIRQGASQEERGQEKDDDKKRNSDRERDRDDSAKPGESKSTATPRAKEAEKRVIGRNATSERGHEGDSGGFGSGAGSGRGRGGSGTAVPLAMQGTAGAAGGKVTRGKFEIELHAAQSVAQSGLATPPKPTQKPPNVLTKAVLDQIVQYCRIVTKTDGDKELDMQLHEQVFKGLKLRVSVVKGKVDATFVTESEEVLNLFNAQKSVLTQALQEKGIAVNSVNVIMV